MDTLRALDLNLLVALNALLDEGSVTGAARRMGLSQPAMSRTLGRLRDLFADPLFVRAGRALIPTPRATALAEPLTALLANADALLRRDAPFDPATAHGELTLFTADLTASLILPDLIARLAAFAPGLDLVIRDAAAAATLAPQLGATPSVAVAPYAPDSGVIRRRPGGVESFSVIARADHPALSAGPLDPATWAGLRHLLIAPRGRPGGVVDTALAARGLNRRVAVRIKTFALAGPIVATSDLVATVPTVLAEGFARTLPVVVLPPPLPLPGFSLDLLWHERYHHDPAHAWFRAAVAATLARVAPADR